MQTIYRAANQIDAQRVVERLAAEGIDAHIQGAYLSGAIGELPAGDQVRVWVADEDVERAAAVLAVPEPEIDLADDDAEPEQAVARQPLVANGWIGLGFGLVLGFALAYWQLRLPFNTDRIDYDQDGNVEYSGEYHGDMLLRVVEDRNDDGKPDLITDEPYDGMGRLRFDDDFDGRFEGRGRYERNLIDWTETDLDGDGFYEIRQDFANGVIAEERYFEPASGAVFKRNHYKDGNLTSSEIDADGDGRTEAIRRYDLRGEILSK